MLIVCHVEHDGILVDQIVLPVDAATIQTSIEFTLQLRQLEPLLAALRQKIPISQTSQPELSSDVKFAWDSSLQMDM